MSNIGEKHSSNIAETGRSVLSDNCGKNEATDQRTVRRSELHRIVPLSDTTIYELEQRGEFPRRFNLIPTVDDGDS